MNFYKRIEELNKKLNDGTISTEEKKELGTLVLEKVSNIEKAYEILKDFLSENYSPALYAKAKLLEKDDKEEEAVQIYNQIFSQNKYYLAAFELASRLVKGEKNYDLALKILDDTNSDEVLILGYKGFIYENLKDFTKAEEFYQKAANKNDIDSMNYLGRLYETQKEIKKARNIYNKAYLLGSISAGYKLAYILEDMEKGKNPAKAEETEVKQSKEAKKILERLANSGDDYSMVDLSLYYPETDKMVRLLNLKAAAKLNTTAFYNLGVYYYNVLPEQIAVHFNFNGEPDKFVSKTHAIIELPIFFTVVKIIISLVVDFDKTPKKGALIIKGITPIISVLVQGGLIAYALDSW